MACSFKKLLREVQAKERISTPSKLAEMFNDVRFYNKKRKLYRATHSSIYRAEIHEIRKDRKPLDTSMRTHYLLSGLSKRSEYLQYPSREESKFAASVLDEEYLSQYGNNIYLAFPSSDAKIVSLDNDAYRILTGIDHEFPTNLQSLESYFMGSQLNSDGEQVSNPENEERQERFPFLFSFVQAMDSFNWEKFKRIVQKHKGEIIKDARQIKEESYGIEKEAKDLLETFARAHEYFEKLHSGILGFSEEVMFDGDEYLMVNQRWFKKNFEFKNGWKLREQ